MLRLLIDWIYLRLECTLVQSMQWILSGDGSSHVQLVYCFIMDKRYRIFESVLCLIVKINSSHLIFSTWHPIRALQKIQTHVLFCPCGRSCQWKNSPIIYKSWTAKAAPNSISSIKLDVSLMSNLSLYFTRSGTEIRQALSALNRWQRFIESTRWDNSYQSCQVWL